MVRIKYIIAICISFYFVLQVQAQDQNYSQFFNNDVYYNPATTGLYMGMRTSVSYRNQWTNLPYDFKSYNVAIDLAERSLPGAGGIGFMFHSNNEGEGMLNYTLASLLLSTRIKINENLVTQFGLTASIAQRRIDWDRLVFADQLNGLTGVSYPTNFIPPETSKIVYPDFNVGTVLNYIDESMNARIGAAVHHIFTPKIGFIESESKMPLKFVAHGDIMFISGGSSMYNRSGSSVTKVNPGILFENQNGSNSYSIGVNGFRSLIYLGIWYRNEDINSTNINTMIFMAGVNLPFNNESRIKIMYSYDYVMNKIATTGGTHEISIIIELDGASIFGQKPGSRGGPGQGPIECPAF